MNPSTMTRPVFARVPVIAKRHAFFRSADFRATLWPWPEDDIVGFITHGHPTARASSSSSLSDDAKRYGEVGNFNFSAARRRMPSLSIVRRVARAVGITVQPSFSNSTRVGVAIA